MKQKLLLLFIGLCIAMTGFSQAERLYVYVLTGENYEEALEQIGGFTFNGGKLKLYSIDGNILAEKPLSEVRKITFKKDKGSGIVEEVLGQEVTLRAYPNPTQDALYLNGLEEGETVRIFSTEGQLLKTLTATGSEMQIEVSDFRSGIYLIQAGMNIVKFIKE